MNQAANFAAIGITLYVSHHVGDYWVQTDAQAKAKGFPGRAGRMACLMHVVTYLMTQAACLLAVTWTIGLDTPHGWTMMPALAVSGVTHYIADRRTPLIRIAGLIPGKMNFVKLGVPRAGMDDNPSLGTGLWALDQSWHIFWGVFVAGLVAVL